MASHYFERIHTETPTRLWVNNPNDEETQLAIAHGAVSCTTNPSFVSKLMESELEYVHGITDQVVRETEDDDVAADLVYQRTAQRIMKRFLPVHERSAGLNGWVTIQADPREDDDPDLIIKAALRHRKLGKNYMAKIPVIHAGCEAIEAMVEHDIPVCATEVFAISQFIYICERWERAVQKYGKRPPFYVTHITGIFDQHLADYVKQHNIAIAPEVLYWAGCTVGRKEYHMLKQRGYKAILLGGGARGNQHWTEFVGADMHITINWSTAKSLLELNPPIENRINVQTPKEVIEELEAKLPPFRRAYHDDALSLEEFKDFGPVQLFRNMFLAGYSKLLGEVKARRALL